MTNQNTLNISPAPLVAGGAVAQGYFLKVSAANTVAAITGATDLVLGVAMAAAAAAGDPVPLQVYGVARVIAGAAVVAGTKVGCDATGRAVTKTVDGNFVAGTALTAASAAGEYIMVLLTPNAQLAA